MSRHPPDLYPGRGAERGADARYPPSDPNAHPHPQHTATSAPAPQAQASVVDLMAAFQQNGQLPQTLQGITPEQFMAIGQLFKSGAFTLPPTVPSSAAPQIPPQTSPPVIANGAMHKRHSVSVEREEGEVEDLPDGPMQEEIVAPRGPRNLSPNDRFTRGRGDGRYSEAEARGSTKRTNGREASRQQSSALPDRRAPRDVSREPFRHPRSQPRASPPRHAPPKTSSRKANQVLGFVKTLHDAGYTFDALVAEVPRYREPLQQLYQRASLPMSLEPVVREIQPQSLPARPMSEMDHALQPKLAPDSTSKSGASPLPKPSVTAPKPLVKPAKPPVAAKATTAERQAMLAKLAAVRNGAKQSTANTSAPPAVVGAPSKQNAPASIVTAAAQPKTGKPLENTPAPTTSVPSKPPAKVTKEERDALVRKRLEALKASQEAKKQQNQAKAHRNPAFSKAPDDHTTLQDDVSPGTAQSQAKVHRSPATLLPQGGVRLQQASMAAPGVPSQQATEAIATGFLPSTPGGGPPRFSLPGLGLAAGQYPSLPGLGSFQPAPQTSGPPTTSKPADANAAPNETLQQIRSLDFDSFAPAVTSDKADIQAARHIAASPLTSQLPSRKRSADAAFPKRATAPVPTAKKPFGHSDRDQTCIIETSDDEDAEESTTPAIAKGSHANDNVQKRGPGPIDNFPTSSSFGTPNGGSVPSTPGGEHNTAYQLKMQEVADLKRRMAQFEARKAAKASGKATPAKVSPPDGTVSDNEMVSLNNDSAHEPDHRASIISGTSNTKAVVAANNKTPPQDSSALHIRGEQREPLSAFAGSPGPAEDVGPAPSATQPQVKEPVSIAGSESGEDMDIETDEDEEYDGGIPTVGQDPLTIDQPNGAAGEKTDANAYGSGTAPGSHPTWLPGLAPTMTTAVPQTSQLLSDQVQISSAAEGQLDHATNGNERSLGDSDDLYDSYTSSSASTDLDESDLPITRQKPSVELSATHGTPSQALALESDEATMLDESAIPTDNDLDLAPELQRPREPGPVESQPLQSRKSRFSAYESPLVRFKDYRYHPEYAKTVLGGPRSFTYNSRLESEIPICQFDLTGGKCNDSSCQYQHFKDMAMTDSEMISTLGNRAPASNDADRETWTEGLRTVVAELRSKGGKLEAPDIMNRIIQYRREYVGDDSKVLNLH